MGDIQTTQMQHSNTSGIGKGQEPTSSAHSQHSHPDGLQSPSISGSTPDHDLDNEIELPDLEPSELDHENEGDEDHKELQPPQPQKRKGGRKPIYATSEERKQRNRQAQAAFRERRTEYIKQLESTIKQHEENLSSLQASHRNAADECLMLRYKNSLLERILVEKGIDVQVELTAKTGSPNLVPTRNVGPGVTSRNITSPSVNRFPIPPTGNGKYGRRPVSISSKSDVTIGEPMTAQTQTRSPLSQATSASHLPSPIALAPMTRSPNFVPQTGTLSPSFGPTTQGNQPLRPQQSIRPTFNQQQPNRVAFSPNVQNPLSSTQSNASAASSHSGGSGARDSQQFFISPFQNHYEQLDQEYDAQANMLDDHDPDNAAYTTANFTNPGIQHIQQQQQQQQQQMPPPSPANPNVPQPIQQPGSHINGIPNTFDPSDPILDADPFGLSASMYFPTPYSFDAHR